MTAKTDTEVVGRKRGGKEIRCKSENAKTYLDFASN